jgi:hypothetical protein
MWHEGVVPYELEPRHVPYHRNYPHAEVWVCPFRDPTMVMRPDRAGAA